MNDDDIYTGIVTDSAAQWGQTIDLGYAHKRPTRQDIQRMADLLRSTANTLEHDLRLSPPPAQAAE